MYTNISNIMDTVIALLERNAQQINDVVHQYKSRHNLHVFKGMRQTLPEGAYPSLEMEPDSASNEWGSTQSQRPEYSLQFTLTTNTSKEELHVEYITTLAQIIVSILTTPENLQLAVSNESRWTQEGGLVPQIILDSLVGDVTFSSAKEGAIRKAEFSWWALIHEPYPREKFRIPVPEGETKLRPSVS